MVSVVPHEGCLLDLVDERWSVGWCQREIGMGLSHASKDHLLSGPMQRL